MKFLHFCEKMEKAMNDKDPIGRTNRFFDEELKSVLPGKSSLYPVFTLIFPETANRTYNMSYSSMASFYIQAVGGLTGTTTATRLQDCAHAFDFGGTLEDILKTRTPNARSSFTLGQMHDFLDRFAQATAEQKRRLFVEENMIDRLSANEHKWFARIVLDNVNFGCNVEAVLQIYGDPTDKTTYERILARYNMTHDLRVVCAELALEGKVGPARLHLQKPFQVHLAAHSLTSLKKSWLQMKGRPFFMDRKVDGERYVVHKKNNSIKLFSRTCREPPRGYYDQLSVTLIRNIGVEECILDGEIVAWDKEAQEHVNTNRSTAANAAYDTVAPKNPNHTLMYVPFDIVYVGGTTGEQLLAEMGWRGGNELHLMPLHRRREILCQVVTGARDKLTIVQHRLVMQGRPEHLVTYLDDPLADDWEKPEEDSAEKLLTSYFEYALDNNWEGLVLKPYDGQYFFGAKSRSLNNWVKLKPDAVMSMVKLHLVIVGAYRGKKNNFTAYLVAARDDDDPDQEEESQMYIPICKVGTGLSAAARTDLNANLGLDSGEDGEDQNETIPPYIVAWDAASKSRPDRWIDPPKSCVLEVKYSEIIASTAYPLRQTLRFPRIGRVDYDKTCMEATGKKTFLESVHNCFLAMRQEREKEERAEQRNQRSMLARVRTYAEKDVISSMFANKVFVVIASLIDELKTEEAKEVEHLIKAHGGTVNWEMNSLVRNQDYIVASATEKSGRIYHMKRSKTDDVLSFEWVLDCIKAGQIIPPSAHHWVATTPETQAKFNLSDPIFFKKEFVVLPSPHPFLPTYISADIRQVKEVILENGGRLRGRVVAEGRVHDADYIIVASTHKTAETANMIESQESPYEADVLSFEWVFDCITQNRIMDPLPHHYVAKIPGGGPATPRPLIAGNQYDTAPTKPVQNTQNEEGGGGGRRLYDTPPPPPAGVTEVFGGVEELLKMREDKEKSKKRKTDTEGEESNKKIRFDLTQSAFSDSDSDMA